MSTVLNISPILRSSVDVETCSDIQSQSKQARESPQIISPVFREPLSVEEFIQNIIITRAYLLAD